MDMLLLTLKVSAGAAIGAGLALGLRARLGGGRPRRWAGAALVLGLAGAWLANYGLPPWPLGEDRLRSEERGFWLLPLGLLATLLPWRLALVPLALAAPVLVLGGLPDGGLDEHLPLVGLALASATLTLSGDRVFRRRAGAHAAVQLGLLAGVTAGVLGATGSLSLAQWAGGLGTAWALTLLPALRARDANLLDGGTLALFVGVFLLLGARFSYLDPHDAALLFAALPATLLAEDLVESERGKLMASWGVLLGVFVAVALRIWLGMEPDPYADYYG